MLVLMQPPSGDSELVQIVDSALADAARQAGEWLVCKPGCTQCCYGAFAINALDVLRLRAGMAALRDSNPSAAQEIVVRAEAWIAEFGPDYPGDLTTGLLGDSEADRERFEDFANDAPCPALDPATGLCGVYLFRPMTCRVFGPPVRVETAENKSRALALCELCFHGASQAEVAACEMHLPHELEARILDEIGDSRETLVAFALLR